MISGVRARERRLGALQGIAALFLAFLCGMVFAQERRPEYQLAAGDVIRISVFQNPDLTIETRVTENGTISYPLVGSVRVGGLSIPAAEQTIATALRTGGFVQKPQVNIALLQNRGNQVSVLGQVNRPGRFPLETFNMRMSEVLAIAGGIAPTGGDIATLTGARDGQPFRRDVDIAGMFLNNKLQDDVVISGGDVIYVQRYPVFYIYGEIQRPGSYRIERGMTIQQAVAQSGGLTQRGTERRLQVFRRNSAGKVEDARPELYESVQADDVIYVRESIF